MRVLGVIPTRMGAVRFPGKPLARLAGRPLVQWVYEAAAAAPVLDHVVVATPDAEIADAVAGFGGVAVLTSPEHPTGTDRVAEVAATTDADVVVNVQGDQPFVTARMLEQLVAPFDADGGDTVLMATLGAPLDPVTGPPDTNVVKVVCDRNGNALYFSRSPIPCYRHPGPAPVLHHLGLYAFRREFLRTYQALSPTPLEQVEGLEQLRALEHGYPIRVSPTDAPVVEVNTPADLEAAEVHVARSGGG